VTEIGFYHLTRTALEVALPRLLGRVLATGGRAVVRVGGPERLAALDTALWLCPDPDWLPHGTPTTGDADLQPIWITTEDDAPNGARHLFLADGTETAHPEAYDRIFDLFDGNDAAALEAARDRWRRARAAGHALTYWQQGPNGWSKRE
jgi:DNA polymerase-3 subunit chi